MARPFFRLKFERIRRHLTQSQLARKVNIPASHICWIETGRMIPTPDELDRLANALLISPPEILMKEITQIPDPDPEPEEVEA